MIFIVDDDDDDCSMLWQAFQKHHPGCLLFGFSDGQELLDHLADYYDVPDLIILDLNMPVMDGITTLKRLKHSSRFRTIPTVLLSSSFETNHNLRINELGPGALRFKPTNYSEFVQLTNQLYPAETVSGFNSAKAKG
ncbi:response regulator receiver domain-containing protein [Larkinella arboricola]|uniref:Response regulator receiver domain-containing protein n=1 Tax=Larkinella arboricola TaxID=643671 RepID=A0A327WTN6_LARAB|nr:response regulator [Larkinella arboricola]RAJ94381.1 response regulator receiver domain-containing protein [Larkinella arboricola]